MNPQIKSRIIRYFSDIQNLYSIARVLSVLIGIYLLLYYLTPVANAPEFTKVVRENPYWGSFLVILYTVISHIFAPVVGSPALIVSIAVFGIWTTMFLTYFASLISAVINFWISRKYGRKWVQRFVGKKSMNEIDLFVERSEGKLLITSRLLGFSLFEIISYSFGFTSISFRKYFFLTAVVSFFPNLLVAYVFQYMDFSIPLNVFIWQGVLFLCTISFSVYVRYLFKRLQKKV